MASGVRPSAKSPSNTYAQGSESRIPFNPDFLVAVVSTVPPDLRLLQKPVHTLLSSASAGLPGDEALDMSIIREDWMRRRVRSHLLLSAERRSSLRYLFKSPLTGSALLLICVRRQRPCGHLQCQWKDACAGSFPLAPW